MPTYDYVCDGCAHKFEEMQSFTAEPMKTCPVCKQDTLRRLFGTGAAILFKGGGFYETDYRSSGYKDAAKADGVNIAGSAADAVKDAAVVITMLPAGKHVLSVWKDLVSVVGKNTLMIDCSTIDVESARHAHAHATEQQVARINRLQFRPACGRLAVGGRDHEEAVKTLEGRVCSPAFRRNRVCILRASA